MEALIIVVLILMNGVFAMSETAVIASRRARLQQLVDQGSAGAAAALELVERPNRFLSATQIGITLIGIITGAFGDATIAEPIAATLIGTPLEPYARPLSFGLVVVVTTYLSLIIGELVPKRLALRSPERVASIIAPPMTLLARATAPFVRLLSLSTDAALWLLGVRGDEDPGVTQEEIKAMIAQGTAAGVFEAAEQEMVEGIFRLDERRISTIMTPRTEIVWINLEDTVAEQRAVVEASQYSRLPACDGDLDNVLGVVNSKALLAHLLATGEFDVRAVIEKPLMVPESTPASRVLEMFRATGTHITLVIDEYGGLDGLVTIQDILEDIVGDIDSPDAVRREDGSWLMDGMMPVDDFKDVFDIRELPGEFENFETLGGFVMSHLGEIPQAGDVFVWNRLRFEIMDMDGRRVDKVLVATIPDEPAPTDPVTDNA